MYPFPADWCPPLGPMPYTGPALPPMQGEEFPPAPMLPLEESYVENILRMNLGKMASVYMTFENNPEWPARVFRGRVEAAGRDHIILSDPETGKRYLLLMVNVDYVIFDEPLQYVPPPGVRMLRR
ncbi:spore coat protein GerQ [Caldinitratiruptor microaerophilus]|uniref:spore coat protein GerQ n=1 Tax=Caldinitratiruptor microaerophilus TaxID=671077 RepID=UPI002231985B|nr:spore coat protein GerQ [Caldinitratiruptor microaerophilus]